MVLQNFALKNTRPNLSINRCHYCPLYYNHALICFIWELILLDKKLGMITPYQAGAGWFKRESARFSIQWFKFDSASKQLGHFCAMAVYYVQPQFVEFILRSKKDPPSTGKKKNQVLHSLCWAKGQAAWKNQSCDKRCQESFTLTTWIPPKIYHGTRTPLTHTWVQTRMMKRNVNRPREETYLLVRSSSKRDKSERGYTRVLRRL